MILVTGASGFLGRAVVAALADGGAQVRALSRSAPADHWNSTRVTPVRGDLLDRPSLDAAIDGVAAIVHLAGTLQGTPDVLRRINVDATAELARAARTAHVPLVVHASSAGVYGDGDSWQPRSETTPPAPQTPYERTKLEGEVALREILGDAVPWIVLRPAGIHGAGRPATLAFYRQVATRRVWPHGPTIQLVQPTTADDVASAICVAVNRPHLAGRVFNVGGERVLPFTELIALIARHIGTRVWQPQLPGVARQVALTLATAGVAPGFFGRLAREVVNRTVDITAAREALDFQPIALDSAIATTVKTFRQQGLL